MSQFKKKCSIKSHQHNDDTAELYDIDNNRNAVPVDIRNHIDKNNLCTDKKGASRKRYICGSCIRGIKGILNISATTPQSRKRTVSGDLCSSLQNIALQSDKSIEDAVDLVCTALANNKIKDVQEKKLCTAIGQKISAEFRSKSPLDIPGRLDQVLSESYDEIWCGVDDGAAKTLLTAMAANQIDTAMRRKLTKCVDIMHSIADGRYLSNICMGEALLLLQFTHSKTGIDLLNRMLPSGSYKTLKRTIASMATEKKSIPENDITIALDNNQVVQRTHMISYMGKQACSTVTSLVYFEKADTNYQYSLNVPTCLQPTNENFQILLDKYTAFRNESHELHRKYRMEFIDSIIKTLDRECMVVGNLVEDSISKDAEIITNMDQIYEYKRVGKVERVTPIEDLDCLNENPNSYASVSRIFDKCLEYASEKRKFIVLCMDGSPYSLGIKLIRETFTCSLCSETIQLSEFEQHSKQHTTKPYYLRKYRRLILRPGSGHIEINASRCTTSFFWTPFIKPIARLMSYTSPNSLEYARRGNDHHKNWNLLMVIFASYSYELIYPYVKSQKLKKITPTLQGFLDWKNSVSEKNKTYKTACDFVFTHLHSLHLMRCGVRMADDNVTLAAREVLGSLFYVTNSFKYAELLCNDTLYLCTLEKEIKQKIFMESSRVSGSSYGEGFDFLLEWRNHQYKSFLPQDTCPTYQQWLDVVRSTTSLLKVRDAGSKRLDLNLIAAEHHPRRLEKAIHEIRKFIRSLGYFENKDLGFYVVSQEGKEMEAEGVDYSLLAFANQQRYYESFAKNDRERLTTILLAEKVQDPCSLSNEQIKEAIQRKIAIMQEPHHSFSKKSLKQAKTKDELLEVYEASCEQVKCQTMIDYEEEFGQDYDFIYNYEEDE